MRAKPKPFFFERCLVNYDAVPQRVVLHGQMQIEGSPQGGCRRIYASLSLDEAKRLEHELHISLLQVESSMPKAVR